MSVAHPIAAALALVALASGGCVPDESPDGPLPGRAELVASFGDLPLGTVAIQENDFRGLRCSFDRVQTRRSVTIGGEGLGIVTLAPNGDTYVMAYEPKGAWVFIRTTVLPAAGDSLRAGVSSGGCTDGLGGRGTGTAYITERTEDTVAGVFAADVDPSAGELGNESGRRFRVLGGFHARLP